MKITFILLNVTYRIKEWYLFYIKDVCQNYNILSFKIEKKKQ